jgi:hypothetical protein
MMHTRTRADADQAAAQVVAMMVAANGRIDDRELRLLEELDAFGRLGISRREFVDLAQSCLVDVGADLSERSWLSLDDSLYLLRRLDAVDGPQRLLVCRLAAAAITADGRVTASQRHVYGFTLARWAISQEEVAQAIRDGQALHQ